MSLTRRLPRGLLLFILIALCAWITTMPLVAQSSEAITLADYRVELAAAINDLESVPEDEVEALLLRLQEQFANITTLTLPSGQQLTITPIFDELPTALDEGTVADEWATSLTVREVALTQLRGAVAQIDASANDNTAARLAVLAEVLARPEFNSPLTLWDRFLQWLDKIISELLPDSTSATGSGWLALLIRLLPWLVTVLIVAAIIWLLSYWLQRLLRSFVTDARIAQLAGDDDMPSTAAEARQQARVAAQSGLYRDAVRRLYLAALLHLAEHDLITYERSLTNREVLVRVPENSPVRAHLEPVITTFDQVWYGVREPDQATFTAYEQEIDTLTAIASRAATEATRLDEPTRSEEAN